MELVQEETTYINDRPKVKVQAVKKSENDKVTLEGTVFGLYAGEDIINAEGKVVVKKDTLIDKVTSDKEGAAAFHSDIPTGMTSCLSMRMIKLIHMNFRIRFPIKRFEGKSMCLRLIKMRKNISAREMQT